MYIVTVFRNSVQENNEQLLTLLSDSVKLNLATEDGITKRLGTLLSATGNQHDRDRDDMPQRGSGVGAEARPGSSSVGKYNTVKSLCKGHCRDDRKIT